MTISVELTPNEEKRLLGFARQAGLEPANVLRQLVVEHLPQMDEESKLRLTAENDPAMALFESWIAAAPTDPDEIRAAEADRQELIDNLNANRIDAGERPLFP